MMPRYPIFIVSKGRWDNRLAARTTVHLSAYGVPHFVIVERGQLELYGQHKTRHATLLVLPEKYLDEYDTFDDLGRTKSVGPGAARNFAWDTAIEMGAKRHWVSDDNLKGFWRYHLNRIIKLGDGTALRVMEDFVDRYENIAMAGPQYYMFVVRKAKLPPYILNTRIYSCNLIQNDAPYRWRGRYNEDTDLSLRMLKDGLVTVQFNAFLQWKETTQHTTGGNTAEFYARDSLPMPVERPAWWSRDAGPWPPVTPREWAEGQGTLPKSIMLAEMHPDVARVSWKFSRWHHEVDYGPFRANQLRRRAGLIIPQCDTDPYGLVLERRDAHIGRWVPMDESELVSSLQLGLGFA